MYGSASIGEIKGKVGREKSEGFSTGRREAGINRDCTVASREGNGKISTLRHTPVDVASKSQEV